MAERQRCILFYHFDYPDSSRGKGEKEGTGFNIIMTRFVSTHMTTQ